MAHDGASLKVGIYAGPLCVLDSVVELWTVKVGRFMLTLLHLLVVMHEFVKSQDLKVDEFDDLFETFLTGMTLGISHIRPLVR